VIADRINDAKLGNAVMALFDWVLASDDGGNLFDGNPRNSAFGLRASFSSAI
jgi:hypothetical protein